MTQTFGPSFVDRAQTTGRGQAAFSLTFQHLQFQSLDGTNLRDGSFVTTANQFVDESTPFDVDRLMLNMDASIVTLAASVGITDELEIAIAAPIVSLYVDGSRVNAYRGRAFTQATAHAQSVGLADLTVRSKYRLAGDGASGVAAALDLRLPTGREQDLLGAGTPSVKLSGIGSIERGGVSAHGNAGVSIGGLARELSYNGAVAVAASPRVTVVGELLGRWINSPGDIVPVAGPHPTIAGVETIRLVPGTESLRSLVAGPRVSLESDRYVGAGRKRLRARDACRADGVVRAVCGLRLRPGTLQAAEEHSLNVQRRTKNIRNSAFTFCVYVQAVFFTACYRLVQALSIVQSPSSFLSLNVHTRGSARGSRLPIFGT